MLSSCERVGGMLDAAAAAAATAARSARLRPQPRLVQAAHEFEAQMMKELLKPMTSGERSRWRGGRSASGSGGALGEFASEALGRGLSEQGGFGIANSIVRQLTPASNQQVTAQ